MTVAKHHIGGAAIFAAIVFLGACTYFLYKDYKQMYGRTIIALNAFQGPFAELVSFDTLYLKAWSKALSAGKTTFDYSQKTYKTQGGKAV